MRFFAWLKSSQERILAAGWRLVLYEVFNYLFNYPLYMWAMHHFGLIEGWAIMSVTSLAQCSMFFWYYNKARVDWLFADAARSWEEGTSQSSGRLCKVIARITKSRDKSLTGILTFVLASINLDPMIVAVHYKKDHFKGIATRDWFLLIASVAIANLWWGFRIGVLVKILEWLFKHS